MNVLNKKRQLKSWFLKLINEFRMETKKLTPLERSKISNTTNYNSPCQIEVFWLKALVEAQIIVITHNKRRKDKEIVVNGPYEGDEFLDKVDAVMKESRWKKIIKSKRSLRRDTKNKRIKYSDVFSGFVYRFMEMVKSAIFSKKKVGDKGGSIIVDVHDWCQYFIGNVADFKVDETVQKIIDKAKEDVVKSKKVKEQPPKPPEKELIGFGTYFYPPIHIGKIPEETFKGKAMGWTPPSKKRFDISFNGSKVIVESDGFIGIVTQDATQAIKILNLIFGVAFLGEIRCFAVKESEVFSIGVKPSSFLITKKSGEISSLRTSLMVSSIFDRHKSLLFPSQRAISQRKARQIIKSAEKIMKDQDLAEQIAFLLEGYTYNSNSEYSQSFIMNWVVIERYINNLWRTLANKKKLSPNRIKKFAQPSYATLDHFIEILSMFGIIKHINYKILMDLKKKRNDLVHEGLSIDKHTSLRALNLGYGIVKDAVEISISQK